MKGKRSFLFSRCLGGGRSVLFLRWSSLLSQRLEQALNFVGMRYKAFLWLEVKGALASSLPSSGEEEEIVRNSLTLISLAK